ncbi:MAG: hypothetical protein QOF55_2127 [Thermoleophilaceae bacterium]|nr:hypothetical protein [Thermoleophilaceae bacterium]
MVTLTQESTTAAYDALAPFYDRYMHGQPFTRWLAHLERIALGHGLRGSRLLDVACGTGQSFLPMVERGYEVTACDISPAMVDLAQAAAGNDADVFVADARDLPTVGRFDLVTCLNDSLNYVIAHEDLLAAFRGMANNLRPGGLLVFDLLSLRTFRGDGSDMAAEADGAFFCWRGQAAADAPAGSIAGAVVEVFATDDGDCWRRTSIPHLQRHHTPELVERLLREAGFDVLERRGQMSAARIDPVADEELHFKVVYFARRSATSPPAGDD